MRLAFGGGTECDRQVPGEMGAGIVSGAFGNVRRDGGRRLAEVQDNVRVLGADRAVGEIMRSARKGLGLVPDPEIVIRGHGPRVP